MALRSRNFCTVRTNELTIIPVKGAHAKTSPHDLEQRVLVRGTRPIVAAQLPHHEPAEPWALAHATLRFKLCAFSNDRNRLLPTTSRARYGTCPMESKRSP